MTWLQHCERFGPVELILTTRSKGDGFESRLYLRLPDWETDDGIAIYSTASDAELGHRRIWAALIAGRPFRS
jgi:hypothetical protein